MKSEKVSAPDRKDDLLGATSEGLHNSLYAQRNFAKRAISLLRERKKGGAKKKVPIGDGENLLGGEKMLQFSILQRNQGGKGKSRGLGGKRTLHPAEEEAPTEGKGGEADQALMWEEIYRKAGQAAALLK